MKTLKTSIYLKNQPNLKGLYPAYIRVKVNNTETAFSSGHFVDGKRWDSTSGFKTKTKIQKEKDIRLELDNSLKKIEKIVDQFEELNESFNAKMVVNVFFGKGEGVKDKNISFLQCFEKHYAYKIKEGIEQRIQEQKQTPAEAETNAELSYNKYHSMKEKFLEYLKERKHLTDMPMKKFDDDIQKDFLSYLKGKLSKNTAQRYFISFNAIFHFAVLKKLTDEYPFTNEFKIKYDKSKTHSLSIEELHTVMTKKFGSERLAIVRDVFVFLCLTGYSYNDYHRIKRSNIEERNGKMFIAWKRRKTQEDEDVPLLPDAMALIKKYENHPDCIVSGCLMPLRSLTKLNEYLKEISACCGINKHFTTKVSRKTFGSIMINAGVSVYSISKLVAHTDIKTTQRFYLTIEDKTKVDALDVFQNELDKQKNPKKVKLKVA